MSKWSYIFLFLLGLGIAALIARFQPSPGYMDADYYLVSGLQIAKGGGFNEWILWNYLDEPEGLPHPSHSYWMPLASLLAAVSILLSSVDSFLGARIIFIIIAGMVPPVTAFISTLLYANLPSGRKNYYATLAGILAVFSGFYLPFLTTIDTFGLYMVFGTLFFIILLGEFGHNRNNPPWNSRFQIHISRKIKFLLLGMLAGLMHLARADGVLWLFIGIGLVTILSIRYQVSVVRSLSIVLGGYFLITGVWMARNFLIFGIPFAPGGVRTLWLVDYDDLFIFPATLLSPSRWLNVGMAELIQVRLWALGQNLLSAITVQGEIFLAPLIVIAIWRLWGIYVVRIGFFVWLITLLVMSLIFPFAGVRGGFFHSGAALQPLFWSLAPAGLEGFVLWGSKHRGWRRIQAHRVFGFGLIGLSIFLSSLLAWIRVIQPSGIGNSEENHSVKYKVIEQELREYGAQPGDVIMVNNPPGYYLESERPAIVIPDGGLKDLQAAGKRYTAKYVLLENNHPEGLSELYSNPRDVPGLEFLGTIGQTHIFEILLGSP